MKKLIFTFSLLQMLTFSSLNGQRFISVRGESEIDIVPDRIELTITFSETENIKKENELQQKEVDLIKLLKSFSIDLKKLSIDNFDANRYGFYNSSSNKVRMSKVYKLQLEKIELFDSLIIKMFEIGAYNVAVTNLHSDSLEEMKIESTKIALDKAKKKAQAMAAHLGCSIGQILEIQEYLPEIQTFDKVGDFYQGKSISAYGVNRFFDSEGEDIGIRKIRIKYAVDVKFELK
ncbi:MAG: SIMPL domain-containing protein [Bacteroidales bacterium]